MNDGSHILRFRELRKELQANELFFTVDKTGHFVICEKKHSIKWELMLEKLGNIDDGGEAPIGNFRSFEEARAFAIGLIVGKNKTWKYT